MVAGGTPAPPPHNLPYPPTPLVGRDADLATARRLLLADGTHLLTLTGPPGVGKTRLALAAATDALARFAHGAWFVDLAPLRDSALVPAAIAGVLGVREGGARPLLAALAAHLQARRVLLVLDNFEQLLPAAAAVADTASLGLDALHGLGALADRSLVRVVEAGGATPRPGRGSGSWRPSGNTCWSAWSGSRAREAPGRANGRRPHGGTRPTSWRWRRRPRRRCAGRRGRCGWPAWSGSMTTCARRSTGRSRRAGRDSGCGWRARCGRSGICAATWARAVGG